jgi:hypothetical protein
MSLSQSNPSGYVSSLYPNTPSGYQANILPATVDTGMGGNSYAYNSKQVGGARGRRGSRNSRSKKNRTMRGKKPRSNCGGAGKKRGKRTMVKRC